MGAVPRPGRDRRGAAGRGRRRIAGADALDLTSDAHLEARGAFTTYDHTVTGVQRTTLPAWRFARRPITHVGAAPAFGEHNTEVLTEVAGYSADEAAAGLTATAPVGS